MEGCWILERLDVGEDLSARDGRAERARARPLPRDAPQQREPPRSASSALVVASSRKTLPILARKASVWTSQRSPSGVASSTLAASMCSAALSRRIVEPLGRWIWICGSASPLPLSAKLTVILPMLRISFVLMFMPVAVACAVPDLSGRRARASTRQRRHRAPRCPAPRRAPVTDESGPARDSRILRRSARC